MEDDVRTMEFIPVLGLPTCILKYGKVQPNTSHMFLVIPGNPGVAEFYDYFMRRLYTQGGGRIPVWGVSHAGHVKPPDGNNSLYHKLSNELCTLEGQIRHKLKFIKENVPKNVKLLLIGHSIGCYMNLKILDQSDHPIERCFQLFPTIERMAVSPNGKVYTPALKYLRWLAPLLVFSVSLIPQNLKMRLIRSHFGNPETTPDCIYTATNSLLNSFSVSNSLFLANIEMREVDKLDEDLVQRNLDRLCFYFGMTDDWCPQQYYRDMVNKFPDGDFRLCENGYSHAYVIDASGPMADVVYEWHQSYL